MELAITAAHWKAVVDKKNDDLTQALLTNAALTEQVNMLTIQLATETEHAETTEATPKEDVI